MQVLPDTGARKMGHDGSSRIKLVFAVALITGASGMAGQLILLRELLIVFDGNELAIGLIIANWLIMESLGALAATRLVSLRHSLNGYRLLTAAYALTLPGVVSLSRSIDQLVFRHPPAEAAGFGILFAVTLFLSAGVSLVHGALFPLACRLLPDSEKQQGSAVGKIYVVEALGTLLGALLLTLFLTRLDSMRLSLGFSVLHLISLLLLFQLSPVRNRRAALAIQLSLIALTCALIASLDFLADHLHRTSLARQWQGQAIVHYENSLYGNIVVIQNNGTSTYFYDGRFLTALPVPDRARLEDYVHLVLASHPGPQNLLVIGGGLGGLAAELLSHPINRLVCVDLDMRVPEIMLERQEQLVYEEAADPRTIIQSRDGRLYLSETSEQFDLILLGLIQPENLQTNRLFTREFFSLSKKRMHAEGILALSLPGSDTAISDELAALNACLYQTVQLVFPHVLLIPGEYNIILASSRPIDQDPAVLYDRLRQRSVDAPMFTLQYLSYRLDVSRIKQADDLLQALPVRINRDFFPAACYYALVYWGRAYSPGLRGVFSFIEKLQVFHYAFLLAFLPFLSVLLMRRVARKKHAHIHFAIWGTGVSGIGYDLLVLFVLQCLYGVVYQMAGLLIALFMAGTLAGGLWTSSAQKPGQKQLFFILEMTLVFLPPIFWLLARLLQPLPGVLPAPVIIASLMLFSALAGFTTGGQFPLAARLLQPEQADPGKTGGALCAADLLGGWLGGLLISVIWFPLLGLGRSLLLMSLLKLASLTLNWPAEKSRLIRFTDKSQFDRSANNQED